MKLQITIDCDKPTIGEAPGPALSRLLTAYAAAIKDGDVREEYLRDSDGNTVGQVEIIGVEPGSAARVIQFGRMVDDALESLNSVGAKHLSAEAMDMVIAVGDALTRMKRICDGDEPTKPSDPIIRCVRCERLRPPFGQDRNGLPVCQQCDGPDVEPLTDGCATTRTT